MDLNIVQGTAVVAFFVSFLLLMAANRLMGYPLGISRCAMAALLGGIHGGACLIPGFHFLGNPLWLPISIFLMGLIAYGIGMASLRRGVIFCLLQASLWGLTAQDPSPAVILLIALGLAIVSITAFAGRVGNRQFVPVHLRRGAVQLNLTALADTGNTLTDPVTGQSVLVLSREPAMELTGLSQEALSDPVGSMGKLPGLRLIPYRSVGKDAGFLLALRLRDVTIGNKRGAALVAFSPTKLSCDGGYEALTGGVL